MPLMKTLKFPGMSEAYVVYDGAAIHTINGLAPDANGNIEISTGTGEDTETVKEQADIVGGLQADVGKPADEEAGTASSGLFAQIERIDEELAQKVTQTEGARLMTDTEGLKLAAMLGIYSHSEEFSVDAAGELQLESVAQEKVTGLPAALAAKVETIKIGENILFAENGEIELPTAANGTLGLVMGSDENNSATVNEDGTIEVNKVSVSKLVQDDDEMLVLNGGNAFVE